jgi:hypothetical protein
MSKIVLTEQSSAPDTPGSGKVAIYVDTSGSLCFRRDDGTIAKIAAAGTYTLTIPASGTAALRDVANTFTQAQTFSGVLTAPGMKPASDSTTAVQIQNAAGTAILTVDTTNSRVTATSVGVSASGQMTKPAAGVVRQGMEYTSIANDGVVTVLSGDTRALVYIYYATVGVSALALVEGGTTTLIFGSTAYFSGTAGTASRINIYNSGSDVYVQNKRGAGAYCKIYVIG